MQPTEWAYKITVGYASKKNVVKTFVVKTPEDMDRLMEIKSRHESDPDALFVTVARTRKPRRYNYDFYETKILVDDSGAIPTPAETDLLFKPAAKQQPDALIRSDAEKAEWARNNRFDNRTCTWM